MGISWQTEDQKAFFDEHLASFSRSSDEETLGKFWPTVTEEWFKRWPLSEPPPELVAKKGTVEKARKASRNKKVEQIKRVFKARGAENAAGGRRNLHLGDSVARKKSEVQIYMTLYYDSRIRETVVERWAKDRVPNLESALEVNIPENEIEPHESYSLKDFKIPIAYKRTIAQELYEAESEAIKAEVRAKQEAQYGDGVTDGDPSEQKEMVRGYQKNVQALSRNIGVVLRNVERKCAAKGIIWLASPVPSKGGKPSAFFQCAGKTPGSQGKDFETFIGPEKTEEFKALFSSWIHEIYPPSEWHLFSLGTDSSSPEQDGEEVATDTDAQPDSAIAGLTGVTPSAVGAAPFQPAAAFSETNTAGNCPPPLDPPPTGNPHPAPPTDVPTRAAANQDQRILDLEALPTNATEATWMKSKKTLKYFRDAHKMGKLSDLHIHWYQLEEALGFQETTPKGFPSQSRPKVIPVFFKCGHNYKKDYGLEAISLGAEIMRWWEEIKGTRGAINVRFGGPTGVYSLVVLMTWWCSLLKGRPDNELTDCFHTLEDIDRVVLSAIRGMGGQLPTVPSPGGSSLGMSAIPPAPQPRGSKRAASDEPSSRKRSRSGKV